MNRTPKILSPPVHTLNPPPLLSSLQQPQYSTEDLARFTFEPVPAPKRTENTGVTASPVPPPLPDYGRLLDLPHRVQDPTWGATGRSKPKGREAITAYCPPLAAGPLASQTHRDGRMALSMALSLSPAKSVCSASKQPPIHTSTHRAHVALPFHSVPFHWAPVMLQN
ncbi:hypothetical protein AAFF_G00419000 [Aldrovandia affinis]|uniref:Uncharacterized protein n=1 Tax=Aldrovandia affinis TaxID=143900 RepID=A0AAD7SAD9_9TELE|nr:hypothetical protein AAFF_G00419000 [Aldrovandia affinis]